MTIHFVKWDATGYRLPTEGEWQYAASYIDGSTWTSPDYASGAMATNATIVGNVAWYIDNAGGTTMAVGKKRANALGLYDMSGNAREWCWDWYVGYPSEAQTDYRGPASATTRIIRGGSYYSTMDVLAVAKRGVCPPHLGGNYYVGLRLAQR